MREILENADLSDKTSFSRYVLNKVTLCPNILSKYTKGGTLYIPHHNLADACSTSL